jgi:hypothetical protein
MSQSASTHHHAWSQKIKRMLIWMDNSENTYIWKPNRLASENDRGGIFGYVEYLKKLKEKKIQIQKHNIDTKRNYKAIGGD